MYAKNETYVAEKHLLEETGMKHMLRWLPGVIGEDISLHYVLSDDSFHYYINENEIMK